MKYMLSSFIIYIALWFFVIHELSLYRDHRCVKYGGVVVQNFDYLNGCLGAK